MKKLIIAAIMVVTIGSSAFALDANKISYKVKNIFDKEFSGAENVVWTIRENFTRANFTIADEKVQAFFNSDGDLIGYSRAVIINQLPLSAIQKIKKEYSAFTVTESIEFNQGGEKSYYVSLHNGEKKQILQVSLNGEVSLFDGKGKNNNE